MSDTTSPPTVPRVVDFSSGVVAEKARRQWPWSRRPRAEVNSMQNVRAKIAFRLIWILAGTIVLGFVSADTHWGGWGVVRTFMTPLITAEVSLLGAATGFYYATHEQEMNSLEKVNPSAAIEAGETGLID
jgi:hypothetical protein